MDMESKILMVEDNIDFSHLLSKKLAKVPGLSCRFDLEHADNLSSALKLLGRSRFDLILLDLWLPDSRGLETFRSVHRRAPETPVVMLTGESDEEIARIALQEGAQDFLLKGDFREDLLMRALRFAMERNRILKEWKQAWEIERRQATHDPLTGLPNRLLLEDRLRQSFALARRQQTGLAVLFVDLDRFKNVNDTLGHGVGDELLKAVGSRLRTSLREEDTVARVGGDEFVVVLYGVGTKEAVSVVMRRIQNALAEPYQLNDHSLFVTASLGIGMYPTDLVNGKKLGPQTLVQNADAAMYAAKELGGNRCCYYFEMNV